MLSEEFDTFTKQMLDEAAQSIPAPLADQTLENVVYQDFLSYRYLLDPTDTRILEIEGLTRAGSDFIDRLEADGASFETLDYIASFLATLEQLVIHAFQNAIPTPTNSGGGRFADLRPTLNAPRDTAVKVLKRLYTEEPLEIWSLLDKHSKLPNFLWDKVYPAFQREARRIHRVYSGGLMANPDGYSSGPVFTWASIEFGVLDSTVRPLELDHDFHTYPANTTNVGITLVFRQRWRPLGMQPGEVVRTVPLGPGQSEKISTKITRRVKTSKNSETSMETESSTETTDTTKDSSELLNEASRSKKWNISGEASYGAFGIGASVSGGMEREQASSSKDTTSNLSEVMEKTASKIKKQSKVSVTTETETGFEMETASMITNPNDQLALTYYYHTLQQQYEVFTYLAEVRNVVYVAERVPAPVEINETWVRKHDWILSRALLDASFSDTLNELIRDMHQPDLLNLDDDDPYAEMVNRAQDSFAAFRTEGTGPGEGGLTLPDIYSEPQRQQDAYLRDRAERARANRMRDVRRNRLYDHIRNNILHYCRAIWAAEDADQRTMRYRKEGRTLPVEWEGPLLDEGQPADALAGIAPNGVTVALEDVLDVTGPIGYSGNYAVYPLRQLDPALIEAAIEVDDTTTPIMVKLPLQEVLNQLMRAPYAGDTGLRDPALALFEREAEAIIRTAENAPDAALNQLALKTASNALVAEILSYLPELGESLVDPQGNPRRTAQGALLTPITLDQLARFLHRRNGTRRFLVDSNNLYVSIHRGDGTALEPFKQAHRYLDVRQAQADLDATHLKNQRRAHHLETEGAYDPDIEKVVIVSDPEIAKSTAGTESGGGGTDDGGD